MKWKVLSEKHDPRELGRRPRPGCNLSDARPFPKGSSMSLPRGTLDPQFAYLEKGNPVC